VNKHIKELFYRFNHWELPKDFQEGKTQVFEYNSIIRMKNRFN
jgi:hypothetical protein